MPGNEPGNSEENTIQYLNYNYVTCFIFVSLKIILILFELI